MWHGGKTYEAGVFLCLFVIFTATCGKGKRNGGAVKQVFHDGVFFEKWRKVNSHKGKNISINRKDKEEKKPPNSIAEALNATVVKVPTHQAQRLQASG